MIKKKTYWSYLAGLFDGEGCIHIAEVTFKDRPHGIQLAYRVDIHITMTDVRIVKWLVRYFGGVYYTSKSKNPKWKDAYRWVPKGNKNKQKFLLGMLPYLIIKRELAEIALEFLSLKGVCPEKRRELCYKSRPFSRRGNSVETNTPNSEKSEKIESELIGDNESAPTVM